jgi:hypothetical protein
MERFIQVFVAVVVLGLAVWFFWAIIATAIDNVRGADAVLPDEDDNETEESERPAWRVTK